MFAGSCSSQGLVHVGGTYKSVGLRSFGTRCLALFFFVVCFGLAVLAVAVDPEFVPDAVTDGVSIVTPWEARTGLATATRVDNAPRSATVGLDEGTSSLCSAAGFAPLGGTNRDEKRGRSAVAASAKLRTAAAELDKAPLR